MILEFAEIYKTPSQDPNNYYVLCPTLSAEIMSVSLIKVKRSSFDHFIFLPFDL